MATLAELLKTRNDAISEKAGEVIKEKLRQEAALKIFLSKDGRKGKIVTVISGFTHGDHRKEALATRLKKSCGVGGRVINATIELQGNVIPAATKLLTAEGWVVKPS